jgi:hypothetical protein
VETITALFYFSEDGHVSSIKDFRKYFSWMTAGSYGGVYFRQALRLQPHCLTPPGLLKAQLGRQKGTGKNKKRNGSP